MFGAFSRLPGEMKHLGSIIEREERFHVVMGLFIFTSLSVDRNEAAERFPLVSETSVLELSNY